MQKEGNRSSLKNAIKKNRCGTDYTRQYRNNIE